jgi:tyrosyl-tRNA synthetase
MNSELIHTLSERGFIHQASNLEGLDEAAAARKLTGYIGFDLTADSLHVGSLIQIMVLRWMEKFGHKPLILLGEATTRIGDPSGKASARPMLAKDQIETNKLGIERVFHKLMKDPVFVTNASWFNDETSLFQFLQDFGPHFSINRMLTFDSVKSRLQNGSLSFLEFNYMLMQAIDFLQLFDRDDCLFQIGGSDQWGNMINGVELIRRKRSTEAFCLTTPLMTNSAGEKMGKTASGAIWLDPDKTSAFEFWQFWRNVEDEKVGEFLRLFTDLHLDEILRLEILEGKELNEAKKVLATEVTALVHGRATAEHAALLASGLNGQANTVVTESMPTHKISATVFDEGITLAQILLDAGLVKSKGEADRMANNNGVKVNGHVVREVRESLPRHAFEDSSFMLSVGKSKVVAVRID